MKIPMIDVPVPWVNSKQMVEVDRAMIEDYHIELIQMMENAGRNLAHLSRKLFLDGDPRGKTVYDPAIRAAATMTLALPKEGLRADCVADHVGELYLADIGVPPDLYAGAGLGLEVGPIFTKSEIVRLS